MKINEICKTLGITKKAINYYERQGLVQIPRDDNGYRVFDESHIKILREIVLYRKLNISTANIGLIIRCDSKSTKLKSVFEEKNQEMRIMLKNQSYLEKMLKSNLDEEMIAGLLDEISKSEKDDNNFILNKLKESFPGGVGIIISTHFANFKFDTIQTTAQNTAWMNIIKYLDETEEIEISESILAILNSLEIEKEKHIHDNLKHAVMFEEIDRDKLSLLKQSRDDIYKTIKEGDPVLHKEMQEFQEKLKRFFGSEGYRENVIGNIRILSREYSEYQDRLVKLNSKISSL